MTECTSQQRAQSWKQTGRDRLLELALPLKMLPVRCMQQPCALIQLKELALLSQCGN